MCPLDNTLDININNLTLTQPVQLSILLKQVNQMKNPDSFSFFKFIYLFTYLLYVYNITCNTYIFKTNPFDGNTIFIKVSTKTERILI